MISRSRSSLAALCMAFLLLAPGAGFSATRPIRTDPIFVDSGSLAGTGLPSGVRAYLGVPFAAPPVRELRWRPPQPLTRWEGTYHADRAAPECIQTLRAHDINHYFGEEATSEDCLYLNIWAPTQRPGASPVPVVVWIYGGGFTIGSASMANYSGEQLASKGVVYVALAYRVGALGLYPATSDAEARRAALDIARDATLGLQMRTWARAQTNAGKSPAFLYLFSRVHPYAPGVKFSDHDPMTIGAYHTADVPYWLQTLDSLNLFRTTRDWTSYDRDLATRMSDAIVSFARTGKPLLSGIEWPVYRSEDERVIEFGDSVRVIALPNSSKMDFLAQHPPTEPVMGEGARPRNRD